MITYWAPRAGAFTIHEYAQQRGAAIAQHFTVREYEQLTSILTVGAPAHIFSAGCQLTPAATELVGHIWDAIVTVAPEWRLLNDPRKALRRQSFLETMATAGLNSFRVHDASSDDATIRYPVFLRERDRHDGPLTGLLESPSEVRAAVRALRMRGHQLRELVQLEYQHTADDHGRFRKYSAFRVGDRIVRTHMMISDSWSVKSDSNSATVESALEEREYLQGKAHDAWLRQVFNLAHIEWGRIDYGVWQGKPQAWEINMNPTIGRRLHKPPKSSETAEVLAIKEEGRQFAHQNLRDAFVALEQPESDCREVHVSLPRLLLEEVQREWQHALRRERNLAFMRRVFQSDVIGWPARLVYRTLVPRR